ncbi:MAG TPA: PadR family transcriptional regulator [Rugosimonospora sp.]|nr:PadR family transcriptional regulator [Rugosimonospora sp.]
MGAQPPLSLADWIVLCLVDENPTHGFAVAALTAEHGQVGRAWHLPRPIVYRCLDRLTDLELVRVEATEAGRRGPKRSILTTTRAGHAAAGTWLREPVAHVRDVRSELLVKLALRLRRGIPPAELIAAQRAAFTPVQTALERQHASETGFGQILTSWRVENVRAAMRFLDDIDSTATKPTTPTRR